VVALGFMASLKVKTIAAVGETPDAMLAGTVDTIVGAACADHPPSSKQATARRRTRQPPTVKQRKRFIAL
jgi:hypothetical protein